MKRKAFALIMLVAVMSLYSLPTFGVKDDDPPAPGTQTVTETPTPSGTPTEENPTETEKPKNEAVPSGNDTKQTPSGNTVQTGSNPAGGTGTQTDKKTQDNSSTAQTGGSNAAGGTGTQTDKKTQDSGTTGQTGSHTAGETGTTQTDNKSDDGNTAQDKKTDKSDTENKSTDSVTVEITARDFTTETSIALSKAYIVRCIAQFENSKAADKLFAIHLENSGLEENVDAVILPSELIPVLTAEESQDTANSDSANSDSANSDSANSDATKDNVAESGKKTTDAVYVLSITTQNGEYLWTKEALKSLPSDEETVKLYMNTADKLNESSSAKPENPDSTPEPEREKEDETDSSAVQIHDEDGKNFGVLLASKSQDGQWELTGEYLYGSKIVYVVAIASIVLLTFAIIVAVDLLIIKLYRRK